MTAHQQELFEKNIKALTEKNPSLAERIQNCTLPAGFSLDECRDGTMTLKVNGQALHSTYSPRKEAEQLFLRGTEQWKVLVSEKAEQKVNSFRKMHKGTLVEPTLCSSDPDVKKVIFLGAGLGHQVHSAFQRGYRGVWVEPMAEIFAFAFRSLDFTEVLNSFQLLASEHPYEAVHAIGAMQEEGLSDALLLPFNHLFEQQETFFCSFLKKWNYDKLNALHRLKVLVVGPIYGGSLTTYRYVVQALKHIGHEVSEFDASQFHGGYKELVGMMNHEGNRDVMRSRFVELLSEAVVARVAEEKPDMVIALAQAPLAVSAFGRLKELKVPVAFWYVEDFRTLPYWRTYAPLFDYFFTIQHDEFACHLDRLGANHYYLPQGCLPSFHKPVQLSEEERRTYGSDLSIVGAGYYNRKIFLKKLADYDFKIWGTAWDFVPPLGDKIQQGGRWVSEEESRKIYNATKININLHSSSYHKGINAQGDFVNPRTYEIAAMASFQLVDERKYLPEQFIPGVEIETFSSIGELRGKIDHYLAHPEEAEKIAGAGAVRARLEHSFEERLKEMTALVITTFPGVVKEPGKRDIDILIQEAGADTELGVFLSSFASSSLPPGKKLMDAIIERIDTGRKEHAPFSKMEKLLYMVYENVR